MTDHGTGDPVFVDRSGRRRRLVTLTGTAGGLLLAGAVLALLAGFTGAGPVGLPGWDDATSAPRPVPGTARPSTRAAHVPVPTGRPRTARPAPSATAPSATAPSSSAPEPTVTSVSPTASVKGRGKSQRRVPTQTPTARPAHKAA
jgi:hypothetical protein